MTDEPYLLDLTYTTYYFAEQSPVVLNYVGKQNGAKGCNLHEPFTYCDLGCGNGLTCNTLAAANPHGEFYGIDLNPQHISNARSLAEKAQLTNVHFLESSFDDLQQSNLPKFDFITLHGVYSWVSPSVRSEICEVLKRFLKPHGLVYVSYNALPGWASLLPIREIMRTFTKGRGLQTLSRVDAGIKILEMMMERKARFTEVSDQVRKEIKEIGQQGRRYLAHEFLNDHWHPLFISNVADEMAEMGLSYCGRATLRTYAMDTRRLAPFQDFLDTCISVVEHEAARSMILNERFRRDLYCAEISEDRINDPIPAFSSPVIGNARTLRLHKKAKLPDRLKGGGELVEMMSTGTLSLTELCEHFARTGLSENEVMASVQYLVDEGWMRPFAAPAEQPSNRPEQGQLRVIHRFNRVLLEDHLFPGNAVWLASPVTGDGVEVDQISGLLLLGATRSTMDDAIEEALRIVEEYRSAPSVKGGQLEVSPTFEEKLTEKYPEFREKLIPVLERLKIVERA
jgi:SAM-dependent methyltransferase